MIMKTRSLSLSLPPLFADLPIISLPAYRRLGISPVVFLAAEAARKEWNEVAAATIEAGRRDGRPAGRQVAVREGAASGIISSRNISSGCGGGGGVRGGADEDCARHHYLYG